MVKMSSALAGLIADPDSPVERWSTRFTRKSPNFRKRRHLSSVHDKQNSKTIFFFLCVCVSQMQERGIGGKLQSHSRELCVLYGSRLILAQPTYGP